MSIRVKRDRRSRFFFVFFAIFCIPAFCPLSSAQEVTSVDARVLMEYVTHRALLVYPAIAKAAHIEGTVVVEVKVDDHGEVVSVRPLSGPPMLIPEAVDCVKRWTFRPFVRNGAPSVVSGKVNLIFSLGDEPQPAPPKGISEAHGSPKIKIIHLKEGPPSGPDAAIASKYFPLWNSCSQGLLAHKMDRETASVCQQAADVAQEFPPDRRFVEKRSADLYAATALANMGNLKNALTYAEKAVAEVQLGHDDDGGSEAAYSVRGVVRAQLGEFVGADLDLSMAEDYGRKGLAWAQKAAPSIEPEYQRALQRDLLSHAEVLKRMNRLQDAQKKLDEASKL